MRLLGLLVVAWLLWATLAFLLQRRLLYPGASMEPLRARDADRLPGVERIWLEHDDGRAEAWLLAPPRGGDGPAPPGPAVVFFHGNGEFIDDWVEVLRPFPRELGMHLLLVEFPGYGRSTGEPTEGRITRVAEAAWDTLARRPEVDPGRMVAMGRSLGGGAAAALTRSREPAALVLQSSFTDVPSLAVRRFWVPPFLVRDRWPVREAVAAYDGPVLVLHGRRDGIIPFAHGEALAAAAARATFEALPCGHNDCPPPGAGWWTTVGAFLEEAGVVEEGAR